MYWWTVPFSIESRRLERAVVLTLAGELVLGPALSAFSHETRSALTAQPPPLLVLNMERVLRVDSAGLGEMILLHSTALSKGVKVVLAAAGGRLRDLLAVTRMDGIFPCFADEQAALNAHR